MQTTEFGDALVSLAQELAALIEKLSPSQLQLEEFQNRRRQASELLSAAYGEPAEAEDDRSREAIRKLRQACREVEELQTNTQPLPKIPVVLKLVDEALGTTAELVTTSRVS